LSSGRRFGGRWGKRAAGTPSSCVTNKRGKRWPRKSPETKKTEHPETEKKPNNEVGEKRERNIGSLRIEGQWRDRYKHVGGVTLGFVGTPRRKWTEEK